MVCQAFNEGNSNGVAVLVVCDGCDSSTVLVVNTGGGILLENILITILDVRFGLDDKLDS
jgi:hypothetical protein